MPPDAVAAGAGGPGGVGGAPGSGGKRGRGALEASGSRTRRAELAVEEERALAGSSLISTVIGVVWMGFVIFGPRTDVTHLLPPEERPIEVRIENPPAAAPAPPTPTAPPKPKPSPTLSPDDAAALRAQREARRAAAAAAAFGGSAPSGGPVGDVSNVLRGTAEGRRAAG